MYTFIYILEFKKYGIYLSIRNINFLLVRKLYIVQ